VELFSKLYDYRKHFGPPKTAGPAAACAVVAAGERRIKGELSGQTSPFMSFSDL